MRHARTSVRQFLLLTTIVCAMTGCSKESPKPPADGNAATPPAAATAVPATPSAPAFDGPRAYGYLPRQTDFGPRVPGTDAHAACLRYLSAELQQYAEAVNLQPFTVKGYAGEQVTMTNLIASFNSKATTRILLLAHWDSRPWADQEKDPVKAKKPVLGANDGASGVAVLLEIARALHATPPQVGVDILLTDGEDYAREGHEEEYLRGSRYFAANLPAGYHPVFGILLDMVGDSQLELLKERYSVMYAPDVVEEVWSAAGGCLGLELREDVAERHFDGRDLDLRELLLELGATLRTGDLDRGLVLIDAVVHLFEEAKIAGEQVLDHARGQHVPATRERDLDRLAILHQVQRCFYVGKR